MNKTAVITGASSGIGRATALLFADKGYRVYDLSRSGKDCGGITHIFADMTDEASVRSAFDEICAQSGGIDVLVNNAGNGISGAVEFLSDDETRRQFEVNLFGTMSTVRAALPALRQNKGSIVFISSAAALFPIPFQTYYSASKAAVNSITMALKNELRPLGVRVCAVMPGDVTTGFTGARHRVFDGEEVYGDAIRSSLAVMEHDEETGMKPDSIAKAVYRQAEKKNPKPISTVGLKYKVFALVGKLLPSRLLCYVLYKMYGGR